jgi:hypothetical protein
MFKPFKSFVFFRVFGPMNELAESTTQAIENWKNPMGLNLHPETSLSQVILRSEVTKNLSASCFTRDSSLPTDQSLSTARE